MQDMAETKFNAKEKRIINGTVGSDVKNKVLEMAKKNY